MKHEFIGYDELGRRVHLAFASTWSDLQQAALPWKQFVALLGGATAHVSTDQLYAIAERLLDAGAVYLMCWGDGASRCEEIIDEAVAMRSPASTIMTTAHEGESLEEVSSFATSVALPDAAFAATTGDVVLLFVENVRWYDDARRLLQAMLTSDRA